MVRKLLLIGYFSLLLIGCASNSNPTLQPNQLVVQQDTAQEQLAEAAFSVSQSLAQMAALDDATHPGIHLPPPPNPGVLHMAQLASIDWTGPLQPIVRKIAQASHYRVRVLGKEPAIPIIIALSMRNVPLADILRDVSYQAEKFAKIKVYPGRRVIEIRYV